MAIALDGGYPEDTPPGIFAGQPRLTAFGRRREPVAERLLYLTDPDAQVPAVIAQGAVADKLAASEHVAAAASDPPAHAAEDREFDALLVKESFARVPANSGAAMEYFYARLFVHYPEMRSMFPDSMRDHMERVFAALTRIIWTIDSPDSLAAYLGQLGRSHRKFGVKDRHYDPFLAALIDTVRYFSGLYWTDETRAAWETVLARAAKVMLAAAEDDAARQPPWWIGEIVQHDQRGPDLAVLTIRPDQSLGYTPGQDRAVHVPRWPRLWRNFSIANAPRENGLIDLHVRAMPGGLVSGSLLPNTQPGGTPLPGRSPAQITMSAGLDRDLICIAAGTRLAPPKAVIHAVLRAARPLWGLEVSALFRARTRPSVVPLPP